mgnify:CR=1 FL=1
MNKNDQKIMDLKEQIKSKQEKLKKSKKFDPITNCIVEFEGRQQNLHTLQKEGLVSLLVKLNIHLLSAKDLGIEDEYKISGFPIEDWVTDVKGKLDFVSRKDEEAKLKVLEGKLNKLLSEEKQVALELEEIESLLD